MERDYYFALKDKKYVIVNCKEFVNAQEYVLNKFGTYVYSFSNENKAKLIKEKELQNAGYFKIKG